MSLAEAPQAPNPLAERIIDPAEAATVDDAPLPHIVDRWVPCDEVTLFAGHGGSGKSFLALSLAVHVALGRAFGPLAVEQRDVLFFSAEDTKRTLLHRLAKLCRALGVEPASLRGRLHLLDVSDIDPALHREQRYMSPEHEMVTVFATKLAGELGDLAERLSVGFAVIDNASDTYDDEENNRAHTRTFIRGLRVTMASRGRAVLLLAHVNKLSARGATAPDDEEDYSGSSAWHNSVRSRLSLRSSKDGRGAVRHPKANLGPRADPVAFEWVGGVPVVTGTVPNVGADAAASIVARAEAERDQRDRQVLVRIIDDFDRRGERVTTSVQGPATTYRLLRAQAEFPANTGPDRLARLLRELESEGTIFRRVVRTHDRKIREVFTRAPAEDCASAPIPTGGGGDDPFKDIEAAA